MEERHEQIAHFTDGLDIEDELVFQRLADVHPVDGLAGEVVGLLKIEDHSLLQLIKLEVLTAAAVLRAGKGVSIHNQRLPLLMGRGPMAHTGQL